MNVNGWIVRVSHILVKLVMKLITLLNVFQICAKHLKNYFWIAVKQKRVFRDKEVSASSAETGDIDTATAGK